MNSLRPFIRRHRLLAAWLLAAALLARLLVPAGYMIGVSGGSITFELCSGQGPVTMAMATPGMDHHGGKGDHGKAEQPCAFSGLSAPSLAGADPILLALAIAFVVATVFLLALPSAAVLPTRLRPPLRAPPRPA